MGEWLTMKNLVFAAGLLHFCQIPAMVAASRMLGWKDDLAQLKPINRWSVQVIGIAIMLTVIGLGIVVMVAPADVAGGSRAGVGLAGFLAVFWAYRGSINMILYRKHWPGGFVGVSSFYALNGVFVYLTGAYLAAFVLALVGGGGEAMT